MPQSGPEAPVEKEPDADSISTSSGEGHAGPNITVVKAQSPVTPVRQRSFDSNRTEPSDEKKGNYQKFLNRILNFIFRFKIVEKKRIHTFSSSRSYSYDYFRYYLPTSSPDSVVKRRCFLTWSTWGTIRSSKPAPSHHFRGNPTHCQHETVSYAKKSNFELSCIFKI